MVLAGTYREARNWSRIAGKKNNEWKYVRTLEDLLGYNDIHIIKVGTWSNRKDSLQIEIEVANLKKLGKINEN